MTALLDKAILFVFCLTFFLVNTAEPFAVLFVIASLLGTAVLTLWDNDKGYLCGLGLCMIGSIFFPPLVFFLPIFSYDVSNGRFLYVNLLCLFPIALSASQITIMPAVIIALLVLLSIILRIRTRDAERMKSEYHRLRDEVTEKQYLLEKSNRELLEKQDYEIHLATLKERNRIAVELHDNIGHVLTGSLLQTGALLATSKDESTKAGLTLLRDTLSDGMDEVRSSIHNLRDESFSLFDETKALTDRFAFCPLTFKYAVDSTPSVKIRYAFLSVLKESLANIARHSNATQVTVMIIEHPALYQLVVRDNGSLRKESSVAETEGMGLRNIRTRIESLHGNVVFREQNGFEVFVAVPKEEE